MISLEILVPLNFKAVGLNPGREFHNPAGCYPEASYDNCARSAPPGTPNGLLSGKQDREPECSWDQHRLLVIGAGLSPRPFGRQHKRQEIQDDVIHHHRRNDFIYIEADFQTTGEHAQGALHPRKRKQQDQQDKERPGKPLNRVKARKPAIAPPINCPSPPIFQILPRNASAAASPVRIKGEELWPAYP